VATGLIALGEDVTWEATHLFVRQKLTARVTAFDRPIHFRDSQIRGPFLRFDHDHLFSVIDNKLTQMSDVFDYESPLGWIGRVADVLFLERYIRRFLERRNRFIKEAAEATEFRSCTT
jgi:ligand-binding SRPBCC domain-containing protein